MTTMIKCRFCKAEVESDARKCPHCGEWLEEPSKPATADDHSFKKVIYGEILVLALAAGGLSVDPLKAFPAGPFIVIAVVGIALYALLLNPTIALGFGVVASLFWGALAWSLSSSLGLGWQITLTILGLLLSVGVHVGGMKAMWEST